jgi:hypothetical protein
MERRPQWYDIYDMYRVATKKNTRGKDHRADLVDYRIKSYKALQNTGL